MLGFTYHRKIQQQLSDNAQDECQDTSLHDPSHKHACSWLENKN